MATAQRINANAIEALKEALSVAFWRKRDLLDYLRASIPDQQLLDGIDWLSQDVYKRDSVRRFIDRLATRQDVYGGLLLQLMSDVAAMDDFPQLAWLEDASGKIARAKEAVTRLRKYIQPYEQQLAAAAAASARITQAKAEARLRQGTVEALRGLRQEYFELLAMDDAQRRGFAFEKWLHGLFELFDLDPRASFRNEGEQVDGGFTLDNRHFLLEGRWRKALATKDDLGAFKTKVDDKAENTLGLFISIEGFDATALAKHSQRGSPLVLADGGDLLAVLDERIDLRDLLRRKHRHAAMTGEVFLPIHRIFAGSGTAP
ncbi:MAG TPA: hypothetical protein VLW49_08200 [Gaiellaceae bacterium]|nr:hypothetical protein [Gaiellaceae bacterium]